MNYAPTDAAADIDRLNAEIEALKAQLPDGMAHCTIRFIECPKGHGRLMATNWIDPGCAYCKISLLRDLLRQTMEAGNPYYSFGTNLCNEINAALEDRL